MIRQIIFFVSIENVLKTHETPVLFFEWDSKSPVMNSAFVRLEEYMKDKFPNKNYNISDWHWADKGQ